MTNPYYPIELILHQNKLRPKCIILDDVCIGLEIDVASILGIKTLDKINRLLEDNGLDSEIGLAHFLSNQEVIRIQTSADRKIKLATQYAIVNGL